MQHQKRFDISESRYATHCGFYDRRSFLKRSTTALAAIPFLNTIRSDAPTHPRSDDSTRSDAPTHTRPNEVTRWDILTIGNLSRVRYWGESDEKGLRPAICTSTFVQVGTTNLIVDPSLRDAEENRLTLDRRTGLAPEEIQSVFITHEHGDHWFGIEHFAEAEWLAAPPVAEILNEGGRLSRKVLPIEETLLDAIQIIPTPGHTDSHHALLFECDGMKVIIAGDSVPMRDFFKERTGYYNAVDFEESARTMEWMKENADIIVPGHDNYFLTANTP